MQDKWKGIPFRPISQFYHERFGGKVYKVPVSVVDDCPNRQGLKGMQTCIFCDVWGSAAKSDSLMMELKDQILKYQQAIRKKYHSDIFLVYFQAYTNTFTKLSALRANFETALALPDIRGLVLGTRPDCLSQGVLDLWKEYSEKCFVAVEFGIQSFFDPHLLFFRRGHSRQQSLDAIHRVAEKCPQVDLGIHLIFGAPNETDEEMIETARICNSLPISNIKLHHLHVLKNTPLEDLFAAGEFQPISLEDYSRRVRIFLEHLSPRFFIHRLAGYSSRWDELVAPAWTADKMGTHQKLVDDLNSAGSYQSKRFIAVSQSELGLRNVIRQQAQGHRHFVAAANDGKIHLM